MAITRLGLTGSLTAYGTFSAKEVFELISYIVLSVTPHDRIVDAPAHARTLLARTHVRTLTS